MISIARPHAITSETAAAWPASRRRSRNSLRSRWGIIDEENFKGQWPRSKAVGESGWDQTRNSRNGFLATKSHENILGASVEWCGRLQARGSSVASVKISL